MTNTEPGTTPRKAPEEPSNRFFWIVRLIEGLIWLPLLPEVGKTFAIVTNLDSQLIQSWYYYGPSEEAETAYLTNFLNWSYEYIDYWFSSQTIIGFAAFAGLSWILGDLPLCAFIKNEKNRKDEDPLWPDEGELYERFIVEGMLQRARKARRVASIILSLMVVTLIVGMWVFITAPGAQSKEDIYLREQVSSFSSNVGAIATPTSDILSALDKATANITEFNKRIEGNLGSTSTTSSTRFTEEQIKSISTQLSTALSETAAARKVYQEEVSASISELVSAANALTAAVKEKYVEPIDSQSTLTRLGSVVILLVALKVLGGLYRANQRRLEHYTALSDAVLIALHRKATSLDGAETIKTFNEIMPRTEPAADIKTPLELFATVTEKLSEMVGKLGELAAKLKQS